MKRNARLISILIVSIKFVFVDFFIEYSKKYFYFSIFEIFIWNCKRDKYRQNKVHRTISSKSLLYFSSNGVLVFLDFSPQPVRVTRDEVAFMPISGVNPCRQGVEISKRYRIQKLEKYNWDFFSFYENFFITFWFITFYESHLFFFFFFLGGKGRRKKFFVDSWDFLEE